MYRTRIGDVELISLRDTGFVFPVDHIWPEADAGLDAYRDRLDADGQVWMDVLCFLVRDGDHTVLVDTGMGPESEGRLLEELASAGVAPTEVDAVVFTHLHGDHTGWNIDRATGAPIFANARYPMSQAEWDHYDAASPASQSFVRDMKPLQLSGHLDLFDGERGITPSIAAVDISGHTPGHTGVAITSAGERGFLLGDTVFTTIDVEQPDWTAVWDGDADAARRRRHEVLEQLATDGSLVGTAHLPDPGFGRIVRGASGYAWQAVASDG